MVPVVIVGKAFERHFTVESQGDRLCIHGEMRMGSIMYISSGTGKILKQGGK